MSDALHRFRMAMAAQLGNVITPEVAAAIEVAAFHVAPTPIDPDQFEPLVVGEYVIRVESWRQVQAELEPLHRSHWVETEKFRHGLPYNPNYEAVNARDRAGRLLQVVVRHQGAAVGHLRMYTFDSLHTQTLVAEEDCLFLLEQHRGGFLAVKLLRYTEECLRTLGVTEIRTNSKLVNRADVLMKRMKYTPVALQFCKILGEKTP